MKVITSSSIAFVLVVSTFAVQLHPQRRCTFDTQHEGYHQLNAWENTPDGTLLGRYEVVGDVANFTFASENPDNFGFELFNNELVLTLGGPLDNILDIGLDHVVATVTPICGSAEQDPLPVVFQISILDLNNKPPVFNENSFSLSIPSPWNLYVPINFQTPISTTDADFLLENALTYFSVSDSRITVVASPVEYEGIPKFGYDLQLFVTDPLLIEATDELLFTITASNWPSETIVGVTLYITKVNINAPAFTQNIYKSAEAIGALPEVGDPVLLDAPIQATDPENSDFVYFVAGPRAHFVEIDQLTGQLSFLTISPGDVENLENGVAIIEVIAQETVGAPPLESSATVLLYFEIPCVSPSRPMGAY